jgi:hypothetical protein
MATKRKVKRYDGEDGSLTSSDRDTDTGMNVDTEAAGETQLKAMRDSAASESESSSAAPTNFKDAFAAARKSGDSTFTFNGKKYTTELASSKPKAPAKSETKPEPKKELKYQSLQDRENEAEAKRRESGRSFYGTTDTKKPRTVRGMKLPEKAMAKGGSASSRGDGIAMRGKTKGRLL